MRLSQPALQFQVGDGTVMWSDPVAIRQRLGQGAFRIPVTDAYQHRCAITGEKALPALEAAHLKPVTEEGKHHIDNGLLFRSDIHRFFDKATSRLLGTISSEPAAVSTTTSTTAKNISASTETACGCLGTLIANPTVNSLNGIPTQSFEDRRRQFSDCKLWLSGDLF